MSCHMSGFWETKSANSSTSPTEGSHSCGSLFKSVERSSGAITKNVFRQSILINNYVFNSLFPEAVPIRKVTAPLTASALLKYFTYSGLPRKSLSDRGTKVDPASIAYVRYTTHSFCCIPPLEAGHNRKFPPEHEKYISLPLFRQCY